VSTATVKFDFSGRSVLVTGGTSGIGEAITTSFVNAGANVLFTGRSQQRGAALLDSLSGRQGTCHFIDGDLTNPEFCQDLVSQSAEKLGGLDIVVNSAGVIYHANADQTTDSQWHETMNINVNAVFYVCRAAINKMKTTGGVILNIASDAGLSASSGLMAYNTSKGAVVQMSRSMARDYGQNNIRVIPICPGDVDTPMLRDEFVQNGVDAESGLKSSAQSVPLNRVCTAQEIADLTLYAASDSASFMSGYPLVIDAANRA
jgi:meso-butanediol dehydrogenase/(S,S)-butanediol dehydrogenase/diacetyl reductase